jgi:YD repeat-containing protein
MKVILPGNCKYAETNYANPHALTGFFSGTATTTYAYDNNGNLASTTGAATSTYTWDYRNRMISAWVSGATSTYAYGYPHAEEAQPGRRVEVRLTMERCDACQE